MWCSAVDFLLIATSARGSTVTDVELCNSWPILASVIVDQIFVTVVMSVSKGSKFRSKKLIQQVLDT